MLIFIGSTNNSIAQKHDIQQLQSFEQVPLSNRVISFDPYVMINTNEKGEQTIITYDEEEHIYIMRPFPYRIQPKPITITFGTLEELRTKLPDSLLVFTRSMIDRKDAERADCKDQVNELQKKVKWLSELSGNHTSQIRAYTDLDKKNQTARQQQAQQIDLLTAELNKANSKTERWKTTTKIVGIAGTVVAVLAKFRIL